MSIPFIDLKTQYAALKKSINDRIQTVLEHGQFILGPEVTELEKQLQKYTEAPFAIACANGTDALTLSFMALGIGHMGGRPDDEVIVPGFSFIATAETVVLAGARPVFVDICKDTYNMDPKKIEAAITSKTKAIVPVSLYGQPADMDEINAIAEKHGLTVVEDAAQSFGGSYKGKRSCNLSRVATTSFFPAKPLGCFGDGGAIFTKDAALADKLLSMRFHGKSPTERYEHINIGTNSRLDTLQAAVLLAKLERFAWEVKKREEIGARYTQMFKASKAADRIVTPLVKSDRTSVFAQYTVWVKDRPAFQAKLQEKGIPTAVHYPKPMYRQEAYKKFHTGPALEVSDWAAAGVVSLPMHPDLDNTTQEKIVHTVVASV